MYLSDLPVTVQQLAALGFLLEETDLPDYALLGISHEHIPALIEIVRHTRDFWEDSLEDDTDPAFWTPIHAMHALGQLQAVNALPDLMDMLNLIDGDYGEIIQTEFPSAMCEMGPVVVPDLADYLFNPAHELWSRLTAAAGLKQIAENYPETRTEAISALMRALEGYVREETAFNGFIIFYLMQLKALDSTALVEQVYAAHRVDESIYGDWEDFQVGIGLLETRLTPLKPVPTDIFNIDTPPVAEIITYLPQIVAEEKKAKDRRKQAKAPRKKSHKDHKKKKK